MRMRAQVGRLTIALMAWCGALGAMAPALALDITARPAVPAQRQSSSDAHIVSFGLFGPESVFESEARGAARILRAWFGATVEPVVRFNSKRRIDRPPLKWSALRYGFRAEEDRDAEEE